MLREGRGKTCLGLYILACAVVAPSTPNHPGLNVPDVCTCVLLASQYAIYAFGCATTLFSPRRWLAAIPARLLAVLSFTPAVTYEDGVIVRGVDGPSSAKGTSVNPCWARATSSSLLIWLGLLAMVSVFCHNVSSPCFRTLWMKSFIFLFISGL